MSQVLLTAEEEAIFGTHLDQNLAPIIPEQ